MIKFNAFQAQPAAKAQRYLLLDWLRFFLALMVVLWHYFWYGPLSRSLSLPASDNFYIPYFCYAVEAFFVISGFVIMISIKDSGALAFFRGRLLRLAPAILVCGAVTLVSYLMSDNPRQADPYHYIWFYIKTALVFPLFLQGGIDGSMWSLTYELRFYALIFVAMLLMDVNRRLEWLAAGIMTVQGAPLVWHAIDGTPVAWIEYLASYFSGFGSFFVAGMLAYRLQDADRKVSAAFPVLVIACFLLCGFTVWQEDIRISTILQQPHGDLLQGYGISVALIAPVLLCLCKVNFPEPVARAGVVLGAMSYPLYLIHQNAGYNFMEMLLMANWGVADGRWQMVLCMIGASYLVAIKFEPGIKRLYAYFLDWALRSGGFSTKVSQRK